MQHRYYFEKPDISEEVLMLDSLCHEVLDPNENVIYTKPSYHRTWPVVVEQKIVYVNRNDIQRMSPLLNNLINNHRVGKDVMDFGVLQDISNADYHLLCSAICPTRFGLYPLPITDEAFPKLYHFANIYIIAPLLKRCHQFIVSARLSSRSVDTLLKWFTTVTNETDQDLGKDNKLKKEMILALLLGIMNYPDYSTLAKTICFSTLPCANLLKNILQRRASIYHRAEFVNRVDNRSCSCNISSNNLVSKSFCGLICTICANVICSSCKNDVCGSALSELMDALGGLRVDASSPDSGFCDTTNGPHFTFY